MKCILILCLAGFALPVLAQKDSIKKAPFEGMDLSWINGQNRQKDFPLALKDKNGETIVTGVAYLDGYFNYNFARPKDNTQTISSTMGRTNEFTLNLASIGIECSLRYS